MADAKLERVVVVVDDLDAVVRDLAGVFDIQLTVIDVESYGIRVALGSNGVELVEKVVDSSPAEKFWAHPLASLILRVDDPEASVERMTSAGFALDHVTDVANGAKEYSFAKNFHGIPLVLYTGPPVGS
jgi:Glyoxalase/Bleomycin resistance protein/Dioxygenase superfamily